MLYLYVLVVKFTAMNFKVYVHLHDAFILMGMITPPLHNYDSVFDIRDAFIPIWV